MGMRGQGGQTVGMRGQRGQNVGMTGNRDGQNVGMRGRQGGQTVGMRGGQGRPGELGRMGGYGREKMALVRIGKKLPPCNTLLQTSR